MRRVAKPRGVVAVRDSDYAGFSWYPADPDLDHWLALAAISAAWRRWAGERDGWFSVLHGELLCTV